MGPYALFSCPEKIRGLPPKTTEEIDFEKKILGNFFVFTLGDSPKMEKSEKIFGISFRKRIC